MKIIHVMNWYVPNFGYQENYLPSIQKKLGNNVEIITSDRYPFFKGYLNHIGRIKGNRIVGKGTFTDNNIVIHRLPCLFELRKNSDLILIGFKKKLIECKPDIVHAHGVFSLLTLETIYFCKKLGFKIVIDDHSHINNFHKNTFLKNSYISFVRKYYNFFNNSISLFLPVTYSSKNILKTTLNISDNKIKILHLGADINTFQKIEKFKLNGRNKLGIKEDDFVIISSGKFDDSKDIHLLLQSFINISKKYHNIKLLLLGNGPNNYMVKLKNIVKNAKIEKKVIFHDFVSNSDLPIFYNSADMGVWPGDHSITAIEAVATGLPIIVPSSDYAYKVLFKNNAALGFDRGSIDSLTKKIDLLYSNKNKLNYLIKNSIEISQKKLGWNVIAKKSLEYYSKY